MDIGTGIFLGLVFIGLIILYVVTRDRWKWRRAVGYPLMVVIGVAVLSSLGYGAKFAYDHRIKPVTDFAGININDTKADIKFKKGVPNSVEYGYWHYNDRDGNVDTSYSFRKVKELRVVLYSGTCITCNTVFDLGIGSTFDEVTKKLGKPEHLDSSENALSRLASYEKLNLIFHFTEGKVVGFGMYNPIFGPVKFMTADEIEKLKAMEWDAVGTVVK